MPYGNMLETTKQYIERRAAESAVSLDMLGLEPNIPEPDEADEYWPDTDGIYTVAVIFGGALDEQFDIGPTIYEVSIADWIAEQCAEEAAKQDGEGWEVIVTEYAYEDGGCVHYVTRSDEF